jgi:two-component system CheB/CheR fusion protein
VKAAGGTVLVQDPRTADFPGMPLALAPGVVDIVTAVDRMGTILTELIAGGYPVTPADEERQLPAFLEQVRERSGIDFASYKRPTILRRLQRRMVATNTSRLRDYVRYVGTHPEEYERLVSSFLIKVTEFFRDSALFQYLRDTAIPEVILEARQHGNEVRIWSAGCATGEEAYSVAMLVAEALGDELPNWNVRIFATDLDGEAILYARRGVYPAASLEGLPADFVERYFHRTESGFQVAKVIRLMTVFGQHDLAQGSPFPRIDIALCRNVLIYFTPELQKRALQLFAFSLREGGFLVLGNAETTTPLASTFTVEEPRLKVYRRHGDRVVIPASRFRDVGAPLPLRMSMNRRASGMEALAARSNEAQARMPTAIERSDSLLHALPMAVVLIDQNYDIQLLNQTGRTLFGIHGSAVGQDFIHLVRTVSALAVRRAVDLAMKGETTTFRHRTNATDEPDGRARTIEVRAQPFAPESNANGGAVVVIGQDVSADRDNLDSAVRERDRERGEREQVLGQMTRLIDVNQQLLGDNNELASANTSLRSANEELLIANEESQAATEEVETLNEELQATNEELETLNEELQATVEELNTTNDEMSSRAAELHEVAASLEQQRTHSEEQRARLAAILAGLRDAVLVIASDGTTVLENDAYRRIVEHGEPELEDEQGQPVPLAQGLRARAARGDSFTGQFRMEAPDAQRRWYEVVGVPLDVGAVRIGGAVIIRDITERSLRALQTEFIAIITHELRTPLTALRGYLELADRAIAADTSPDAARFVGLGVEQATRLQSLIGELFDTARSDIGRLSFQFSDVDLNDLVVEAPDIARTLTDDHRVDVTVPAEPLPIRADAGRLRQVILNVVANAINHAPDAKRIEVVLVRTGDEADLRITDHGPGIPADVLPHLFSRYGQGVRSSGGGLGLGLFISREIVTAHRGTISATQTPGGGATIIIRLPLAQAPIDNDGRRPAPSSASMAAPTNPRHAAPTDGSAPGTAVKRGRRSRRQADPDNGA